jgi:hypothetical protein
MLLTFIILTYNKWYIPGLLQKINKLLEVDVRDSNHNLIWWWKYLFYQIHEDFTNTSKMIDIINNNKKKEIKFSVF